MTHTPHQAASLRRLERKVDELTVRMDTINLNGSAAALLKLAQNADQLLRLAEVAPRLVEAVEQKAENAAAMRAIKRWLNPLRPVGAFTWLLFTTVVSALVWAHFSSIPTHR